MWYNEDNILQELNATELPVDDQQALLDNVGVRVGEEIEKRLSEQQINEYRAIVDADQDVIFAWLNQNQPDYKNDPIYNEVASGYDADPEKIQPEKIVASLSWVKLNVPDASEIVSRVVLSYKQTRTTTVQA